MALTPDQAKELRDMLKEIEQLSIKLGKTDINIKGFSDLEKSAGVIKMTLSTLQNEWKDLTKDISIAAQGFRDVVKEITNQNLGLNDSKKAYKELKSIAEQINAAQKGSGDLTLKEISRFKERINQEKERLSLAQKSLLEKEKEQKIVSDTNKANLSYTQKQIDKLLIKDNLTTQDIKRLKNLESLQKKYTESLEQSEEELKKTQDILKQNKAIIEGNDEAFKNLSLNIGETARKLKESFVSDLDKNFKNIIEQVQTTDDGIKKINKSYDTLSGIAQKIQDHQSGTNEISEKEAKKLLEKLESERKRLANNQELLKTEYASLEAKKEATKLEQESITSKIQSLENEAKIRTLQTEEVAELETLKQQQLTLLETQKDINSELDLNKKTQEKISNIIKGQDKTYNKLVEKTKEIQKQQENIRKAAGLGGAAVDGIGKAFSKMGLGGLSAAMGLDEAKEKMKEVSKEVTNGGEKAAGLVGKFKVLGAGLGTIGKNIFQHLTDPLTLATGLVSGIVTAVKFLINLFEETAKYNGDIAKTFGLSARESAKIGDNLRAAAGSDFFMTNEEARKAFDAMANATGTINKNFSDPKALKSMNDMVTFAGYSTEEAGELFKLGQLNNKSADEMVSSLQGQLKTLQVNNKLRINEKQAVELVAKASSTVRMNLGQNPKALAQAAFYATKLGMTLDEIASAAEQTLNFESSIQNQLEYQVLTGKELNIDAYQQAAASGDAAKAAEEMNRILEEQGPNIQNNVFAQEALAKTLGVSREQMMKSLELQKIQKKTGGDIAQIESAINRKMKEGLSYEQAAAEVAKEDYKTMVAQNKNAEVFSRTISEIKEAFVNALAGSEGFKDLFSADKIKGYISFIQTTLIPLFQELGRRAGDVLKYLTDPEKLKILKEKFESFKKQISESVDLIKGIGIAIGGIALIKGVQNLRNLLMGQRGSSFANPLFVKMAGGGGMPGTDDMGLDRSGKPMSRRQRNINRALKTGLGIAAAYTAYNALSGKNAEDFSQDEVQSYMQQTGITDEKQAREQMASQQYQTGSRTGDLAVAGVEAASAASINTGKPIAATSPKPLAKNQKAAYEAARSQGVPAQQAMNQARNVKPEKGMFGKAFDFVSDMGSKAMSTISDVTGITKAKDWFAKNIKSSLAPLMKSAKNTLKPVLKTLPFVGPVLDLVFMGMDINSIAKQQNVSPEELYSQIGKSIIGGGMGMLGGALAAAAVSSTQAVGIPGWILAGAAYTGGSYLGNMIGSAISDYVGGPALGKAIMDTFYEDAPKSQPQQVQDGSLNPNGGPVVSTFQKGELVPVMQGIKEDNVYMTTNKPVAQVQDGYYGKSTPQDNSAVITAINKLTEAIMSNSNKEIVLKIGKEELARVMTGPILMETKNTAISF